MEYAIDLNSINEYNTHSQKINPKKAALLVIEMQNVFLNELEIISEKQIRNIQSIISAADRNEIMVILVRHNDSSDASKSMIEWWGGDKIEKGSKGWELIEEFNTGNRVIIDKNQYSAFHKTDLNKILKANKIEDVIITGVMTNCCCETTAREAFMYGYRVFFINDATSTVNDDLHLSSLKNLAFGFAFIQNHQQLVADIESVNK